MKTVVIIADSDPRKEVLGGIAIYSKYYAQSLEDQGARVIFIGKTVDAPVTKEFENVVFFSDDTAPRSMNPVFLMDLFRINRSLELPEDAIIHAQRPDWILPFRNRRNRKMVTLHGSHSRNVTLKKGVLSGKIYSFLEKKGLETADSIISVSEETIEYYKSLYRENVISKMVFIPPGVDIVRFAKIDRKHAREKYGFGQDEAVALFLGRFEKEKNPEMFLRAIQKAGITGFFVGSGSLETRLKKIARETDVRIVFNNPVKNGSVPEILACADILALTSLHEGFPLVLIEAMAAGVPCISTDVGDAGKIVEEGVTGYLVDDGTIVEKMKLAVKNSIRFGPACRQKAESYTRKNYLRLHKL